MQNQHLLRLPIIAILIVIFIGIASFFYPASDAHAASKCGGEDTAVIQCANNENGVWGLLLLVIGVMSAGVGILAVGGIVYASILWTTAEDKQDQITKAKDMITNTVIGIVAFALMWSGLQFIVPGGVFNRDFDFSNVDSSKSKLPGTDENAADKSSSSKSGGGSGTKSSTATLGDVKQVSNLRDASATNKILKPNTLFRSGQLTKLNKKNAEKLGNVLGKNATIIDLRPPGGEFGKPDKKIPGAKNLNFPIQGVLDTAPMVNDQARAKALGRALKAAANADGAVLIHCVAGKDRTGWMVAMIMYANGASDKQVMTEYLKSLDYGGEVKREWLNSGLQAARKKHGTIINYLKSIGLTNSDLKKLKQKFGA